MKPSFWVALGMIVVGAAAFAAVRSQQDEPAPIAFKGQGDPQMETPGMCAWREPESDTRRFFPTATKHTQKLLIFPDLRLEITKDLGPHSYVDANGIYIYNVSDGHGQIGTIIPQRFPGEYGVVEYGAAFDTVGKIAGIRVQRLREPDAVAKAIETPSWLHAFEGRDLTSSFVLGKDIPQVDDVARPTAQAFVDSVHRLTVEYDVAHAHGR